MFVGVEATDSVGVHSTFGSTNTYAYSRGLGKLALVGDVGVSTKKSDNFAGCVTACYTSKGSV